MAFIWANRYETDEEEALRLSKAPRGSINHKLSELPVKYTGLIHKGLVVALPNTSLYRDLSITVVVRQAECVKTTIGDVMLHDDSYSCIVISSNSPTYSVGGNDISVFASQIRRGEVLDLNSLSKIPF